MTEGTTPDGGQTGVPTPEEVEAMLDSLDGDQAANEILEVKALTQNLKRTFALVRKEIQKSPTPESQAKLQRLIGRVPSADIPDIIDGFADRVAGTFLAVFRQMDGIRAEIDALASGEGLEEYEDEDDEQDIELEMISIEEARTRAKDQLKLLDFVDSLGAMVPEDIQKTVNEARKGIDEMLKEIEESLATRKEQEAAAANSPKVESPEEVQQEADVSEESSEPPQDDKEEVSDEL